MMCKPACLPLRLQHYLSDFRHWRIRHVFCFWVWPDRLKRAAVTARFMRPLSLFTTRLVFIKCRSRRISWTPWTCSQQEWAAAKSWLRFSVCHDSIECWAAISSACGMIQVYDKLHTQLFVSVQELQKVTTLQVRQCELMLDIKPTSSCSGCWKNHRRASENESKMLIRSDDVLHLLWIFGQLPSGNTQSNLPLNERYVDSRVQLMQKLDVPWLKLGEFW